ncbi:MAG: stage II sporulation protein P [Oscillospiraceae bacterium]|nr:stage II sporulation protein P [Oscillospiraceae bacterium]
MRLKKSTRRILFKAAAGVLAVCISPLAVAVAREAGVITGSIPLFKHGSTPDKPLEVVPVMLSVYSPDGDVWEYSEEPPRSITESTAISVTVNSTGSTSNISIATYISTVEYITSTPHQTPPLSISVPPKDPVKVGTVIERNKSEVKENLSLYLTDKDYIAVSQKHLNFSSGASFVDLFNADSEFAGQIRNKTDYTGDVVAKDALSYPNIVLPQSDEPQVLILHTHETESYLPDGGGRYSTKYNFRSSDPDNGVFAVGTAVAEQLAAVGITVIHDGTPHDYPNYTGAYTRSRKTAKQYLAEYPSIKVILDIHRDGITSSSGAAVAPIMEINGRNAAQVMIISAADTTDGKWDMPRFRQNLSFAAQLEISAETLYAGLTRPILFQYCNYNQDLTPYSLLLEFGANGNTIGEAVYAGELFGEALARTLRGK